MTFPTIATQPFYDLRTLFPSEYAFSITDNQLLSDIQRHLIEPVTNPWTGTSQFSIADISEALQTVRDEFQLATGIHTTRLAPIAVGALSSRIPLNQSVIDVRRSAWKDTASGIVYPLVRTDEYAANAYSQNWAQTFDLPFAYSIAASPPITLQLIPPNLLAGSLDLCVNPSGPALICNPISPALVGIPDDLVWGVTWGALACLLAHDSPSKDAMRSQIAEELHDLAIVAARSPVSSLLMSIAGAPLGIESLEDTDRYRPNWPQTLDRPEIAAYVSPNLFALVPVPNAIYTVTVDLVRSFPVPDPLNPNTTYLQVGAELIDPILDMAQYLASFKEGTSEIQAALPGRQRFIERCGLMNQRLRANATYNRLLDQPAARQSFTLPRIMPDTKAPEVVGA